MEYMNNLTQVIKSSAFDLGVKGCQAATDLVTKVAVLALLILTAKIVFSSTKPKLITPVDAKEPTKEQEVAQEVLLGGSEEWIHVENPAFKAKTFHKEESFDEELVALFLAGEEEEEQTVPIIVPYKIDPRRFQKEIESRESRTGKENSLVSDWMKQFAKSPDATETHLRRNELYKKITDPQLKTTLEKSLLGVNAKYERSKGSSKLKLINCDPFVYQSIELLNEMRKGGPSQTRFISFFYLIPDYTMKETIRKLILNQIPSREIQISDFMDFMTLVSCAQETKRREGKDLFKEFSIASCPKGMKKEGLKTSMKVE